MIRFFNIKLCYFLLLFSSSVLAVQYPDKPADSDWFIDKAGIIDNATAQSINQIATQLWSDETIPVYVVTIESLAKMDAANYSIENYATSLFNHWEIGSQDRNYGMLLLISKGDRRVRIELGSAWQHQYDTEMKTVIDTLITPEFKRGDYSRGIVDGVRGMNNVVRGLDLPKPNVPWWRWAMLVLGIVAGISAIVSLFRAGRRGWAWLLLAALGGLLLSLFIPRSGNWGSNNDDSGSSGGFGGGDSDGGGASGDW